MTWVESCGYVLGYGMLWDAMGLWLSNFIPIQEVKGSYHMLPLPICR